MVKHKKGETRGSLRKTITKNKPTRRGPAFENERPVTHTVLNKRAERVVEKMLDATPGDGSALQSGNDGVAAAGAQFARDADGPFSTQGKLQLDTLFDSYDRKKFDADYRAAVPNTDELLSTSTIRSMVEKIIDYNNESGIDDSTLQELKDVLDLASEARIPTQYSGFSVSPDIYPNDSRMQHPTSGNEGIFGETSGTGSLHSDLDRRRKGYAVAKMEEELGNPGFTITSIVEAGLAAAIEFTLNQFTAPISARDVQPFSTVPNSNITDLLPIIEARESMKRFLEDRLGIGVEQSDDHSYDREWGSRPPDGRASPFRDGNSTDASSDTVVQMDTTDAAPEPQNPMLANSADAASDQAMPMVPEDPPTDPQNPILANSADTTADLAAIEQDAA